MLEGEERRFPVKYFKGETNKKFSIEFINSQRSESRDKPYRCDVSIQTEDFILDKTDSNEEFSKVYGIRIFEGDFQKVEEELKEIGSYLVRGVEERENKLLYCIDVYSEEEFQKVNSILEKGKVDPVAVYKLG